MAGPSLVLAKPGDANTVVVVDGDSFRVFDISAGSHITPVFVGPTAEQQAKEDASLAEQADGEEDGENPQINETEKKGKGATKKQKQAPAEGSKAILNAAFSYRGEYFVAVDGLKTMTVFCAATWKCLNTRFVPKRSTSVTFTGDDRYVLVADKSGDVTSFAVTDHNAEPTLCLGLLSMLLDLTVDAEHKMIITADRDEKIRVSHFPNAYNIQAYCLGHTAMVTAVSLVPSRPGVLVSGAADSTVRTWRHMDGTLVHTEDFASDKEGDNAEPEIVLSLCASPVNGDVAVALESRDYFFVFAVNSDGQLTLRSRIAVDGAVNSLAFTASGTLVAACEADTNPIRAYALEADTYVPLESDGLSHLNSNASFGECREGRTLLRDYLKRSVDVGVQAYHQRKEQRIAGERERKERLQKERENRQKRAPSDSETAGGDVKRQKEEDDQ